MLESEVGTPIKDTFGMQTEDTVENGLADSLAIEGFTATMNVLEQKWNAEVKTIVGLGFPPKPHLQNANECPNSVLKPSGLTKSKYISEVCEKRRTAVKKQENRVMSLLNQGKGHYTTSITR